MVVIIASMILKIINMATLPDIKKSAVPSYSCKIMFTLATPAERLKTKPSINVIAIAHPDKQAVYIANSAHERIIKK